MLQRIGYGILAIGFLVLLFVQDVVIAREAVNLRGPWGNLLARGSLIPVLFVVVLVRAAVELNRILRATEVRPHARFVVGMIMVLLLIPWLSAAGWLGSSVELQEGWIVLLSALLMGFLGAGALVVARGNPQGAIRDMGATLLGVLYLGFLGSFGVMLRCGRDIPGQEGAWLLLIVLLITKASDIGAYFVGTSLGRHKLIVRVSPAKSVEGAIGGVLGSAAAAMLFVFAPSIAAAMGAADQPLAAMVYDATRSFTIRHNPDGVGPVVRAAILGVSLSVAGQIGDLFESCLKRDSGIKDSGRLIPRYGGILDLIDSPLFAMPVAWFLLTAVFDIV